MENKDRLVEVTNISNSIVVYDIEELKVRRQFTVGETKKLKLSELEALRYTLGGESMLTDALSVRDKEAIAELGIHAEPEYFWSKDDVIRVLQTGTIDELADALDFAPEGITDMIKDYSVALEVRDMKKRELIQEKLGFNVTQAIRLKKEYEDEGAQPAAPAQRRVARVEKEAPVRIYKAEDTKE